MTLEELSSMAGITVWSLPTPTLLSQLYEYLPLLSAFPQLRPSHSAQLDFLLVCAGIEEVMAWMDLHVHRGGEKKHTAQDCREVVHPACGDRPARPSAELALEEALPAWTSRARGPLPASHPLAWVPGVCMSAIADSPRHESLLQYDPWQRGQGSVPHDGRWSWGISISLDFSPVFVFFFFLSHLHFVFSHFECFPTHHV